MSEDKKYCPICFASLRDDVSKCLEEECAWWDENTKKCSILLIATKEVLSIKKYIEEKFQSGYKR